MFPVLLCVGATKADGANRAIAEHGSETVGAAVEQAVQAIALLTSEPIVLNDDNNIEIGSASKRDAMLGDVAGVLRGVKLDVHAFFVDAIKCLSKHLIASTVNKFRAA
jgi:hypothetical protein